MSIQQYGFYGCYLLKSENPQAPKGKSYIGFTVNPARRIRQHNGDLANGGARRTKSLRPWRMLCIVHGFRSQVQGLQFEWGWQNPLQCRSVRSQVMAAAIPGCKMTSGGRQREPKVTSNLQILAAMLSSPPWSRMPLTVTFFDESLIPKFPLKSGQGITVTTALDVQSFTNEQLDEVYHGNLLDDMHSSACVSCEERFIGAESRVVRCPGCGSYFHARCAARCFRGDSLIPDNECQCPICTKLVLWAEFVRSAFIYCDDGVRDRSHTDTDSDTRREPDSDTDSDSSDSSSSSSSSSSCSSSSSTSSSTSSAASSSSSESSASSSSMLPPTAQSALSDDDECMIVDPVETVEPPRRPLPKSPAVRSPVVTVEHRSLRDRLFNRTNDPNVFHI